MSSVPDKANYPTDEKEAIVADVDIPGPYPGGRPADEPLSSEPAPTKATRDTGSLGDLTEEVSQATMRPETGGMGSPLYDDDNATKET